MSSDPTPQVAEQTSQSTSNAKGHREGDLLLTSTKHSPNPTQHANIHDSPKTHSTSSHRSSSLPHSLKRDSLTSLTSPRALDILHNFSPNQPPPFQLPSTTQLGRTPTLTSHTAARQSSTTTSPSLPKTSLQTGIRGRSSSSSSLTTATPQWRTSSVSPASLQGRSSSPASGSSLSPAFICALSPPTSIRSLSPVTSGCSLSTVSTSSTRNRSSSQTIQSSSPVLKRGPSLSRLSSPEHEEPAKISQDITKPTVHSPSKPLTRGRSHRPSHGPVRSSSPVLNRGNSASQEELAYFKANLAAHPDMADEDFFGSISPQRSRTPSESVFSDDAPSMEPLIGALSIGQSFLERSGGTSPRVSTSHSPIRSGPNRGRGKVVDTTLTRSAYVSARALYDSGAVRSPTNTRRSTPSTLRTTSPILRRSSSATQAELARFKALLAAGMFDSDSPKSRPLESPLEGDPRKTPISNPSYSRSVSAGTTHPRARPSRNVSPPTSQAPLADPEPTPTTEKLHTPRPPPPPPSHTPLPSPTHLPSHTPPPPSPTPPPLHTPPRLHTPPPPSSTPPPPSSTPPPPSPTPPPPSHTPPPPPAKHDDASNPEAIFTTPPPSLRKLDHFALLNSRRTESDQHTSVPLLEKHEPETPDTEETVPGDTSLRSEGTHRSHSPEMRIHYSPVPKVVHRLVKRPHWLEMSIIKRDLSQEDDASPRSSNAFAVHLEHGLLADSMSPRSSVDSTTSFFSVTSLQAISSPGSPASTNGAETKFPESAHGSSVVDPP